MFIKEKAANERPWVEEGHSLLYIWYFYSVNISTSPTKETPMDSTFSTTLHLHMTIISSRMHTLTIFTKKQNSTMASEPPICKNYTFYQN